MAPPEIRVVSGGEIVYTYENKRSNGKKSLTIFIFMSLLQLFVTGQAYLDKLQIDTITILII